VSASKGLLSANVNVVNECQELPAQLQKIKIKKNTEVVSDEAKESLVM
jgi:hypothetical protein